MCSHHNDKKKKGNDDMAKIVEETHNADILKLIPKIKGINGKFVIDPNDPKQVEWFKKFTEE